jgi:DNA-binding transcriptional ArsR family regulator
VIRIELSDDDLSRTRLAISPLWELVGSLFVLHMTPTPAAYAPWTAQARRALQGVELGPLSLDNPLDHSCPDFAAPIPVDPLGRIEDEIERVRATDPALVRADLRTCWPEGPPPTWAPFAARPREMLDRLCEGLYAYWEAVLAREWTQLRAVLEGEMLGRARSLALSGPAAVLEELHPSVRWRPPAVEIRKKDRDLELELEGRPLVLIPLVFAGSVLLAGQDEGATIGLAYQPRGTEALWAPENAGVDERLELLLGHGRAAVLRALAQPATTTELATRLSYAPSTVSAHLDVLARAGLVERQRLQRRVFYRLNDTGSALVSMLAEMPAALSA